jgi:RNA polymerase sigma factor (sigma-70 family)
MADAPPDTPDADWAELLRLRKAHAAARSRLIQRYLPWTHGISSAAHARMPARVRRDEVASEARMGLIQAVDRYEGGTPFEAYARPRVLGAIRDWARRRLRHPEFSLDDLMTSSDRDGGADGR